MELNKENGLGILKRMFSFSGRASRKEYWLYSIGIVLVMILNLALLQISDYLGIIVVPVVIALLVASLATTFRRLHDLGLSGFWICYLTPLGLAALTMAYLLGADNTAEKMIERIRGIGSPWLSWIITAIFWFVGFWVGSLMIAFAVGQKGENQYGPDPLA